MALGIYAGASASSVTILPSPVSIQPTFEQIWSENTGRAQSTEGGTTSKGKMIGDVIAEKRTYSIKWGVITDAQMTQIKTKLVTGFFFFAVAASQSEAESNAKKYYRSEIAGDYLPIGNAIYWKDVKVSVIEQ